MLFVIGIFASLLASTNDSVLTGVLVFSTVLIPLVWLISTVFIWRETPAERGDRIHRSTTAAIICPTCGYNLTGLNESRCPECGSGFTLDELLAAQPSRVVAEDVA